MSATHAASSFREVREAIRQGRPVRILSGGELRTNRREEGFAIPRADHGSVEALSVEV